MNHDVLAALLAPIDPAAFFERVWERAPLHLRAEGRRDRPLVTHEALVAALRDGRATPGDLLLFPDHAGREAPADLLAGAALLDAYLEAGHPVVWNRARGLFPAVDALAEDLSVALGAHVWPNVYATGRAGTPFDIHFDCHEVIAVQCEGEKAWTVSEVRVDRPLDLAAMEPTVRAVMKARRDEAAARVLMEFTAGPGDVVYIPRGQFHNAKAASARSLHVTFGISLPTGADAARALADLSLADPGLREYLPPAAADPGGPRAAAAVAEVRARLVALVQSGALDGEIEALRAQGVARSRLNRG